MNDMSEWVREMLVTTQQSIPGTSVLYKYAKVSYQNDPVRLLLEVLLVVFMVWTFVSKRYNPADPQVKLTEKEISELIDEWEPEPLVQELSETQKLELERFATNASAPGLKPKLQDGRERFNFASFNFLGIMNQESTKEKAIQALRKYGVGTCGPPGFYGTLDIHLELEQRIAAFLGTEASLLYSQGFACISSVIQAFAKRGDVIVVDDASNFAIQKGVQISRSNVRWFKHNDMEDLERVLLAIKQERKAKKLPLVRQFIVVEGLYANTGRICPLPELIALKKKYKYRLMVEESMSLGCLGSRGAGVSDHFGIPATEIDMLIASLSNAFAAGGGFCAGSQEIVDHQPLTGQAYTFSASMPAMLTVAAIEAINLIETKPGLVADLTRNSEIMRTTLTECARTLDIQIESDVSSPLFHIRLTSGLPRDDQEKILQDIVDQSAKDGVLLTRAKYVSMQERNVPVPSIRVCVSAGFSVREVERAAAVIRDSLRRTLKKQPLKLF